MFLEIALALIVSRLFAEYLDRKKQPAVIGEIFAGILLGYVLINFLDRYVTPGRRDYLDFESDDFEAFAKMGIVFLLFMSGLEVDIDQINRTKRVAFTSTVCGVALPLFLGYLIGMAFHFSTFESLVIGVLLTATSVGVTARTMIDLNVIHTDVGVISLSASVMDDVLGLILLVMVLGTESLLMLSEEIIIFFVVSIAAGLFLLKYVMKTFDRFQTAKSLLAISLAVCFLFAAFAEHMGLAAIIGAFIAGVFIGDTVQSKRLVSDIRTLGYGIFIPIFFVSVGVHVNLSVFASPHVVIFGGLLILAGVIGKVMGRSVGTVFAGMGWHKGLQNGIGSIPRMEVALITIFTAIKSGKLSDDFSDDILAATIILTIVTTLITPPLLRWAFRREVEDVSIPGKDGGPPVVSDAGG